MKKKTLFRRVFESMVEGRASRAQRYIDEYLKSHRKDHGRQG